MTDRSRRAGRFALPVRASSCTSTCAVLGLPLLAACTDNTPADNPGAAASANPRALTVQATDTECKLSATSAPSGTLTFAVTNGGSKVTSSTCTARTASASSAKWRTSGPALLASWC